MANTTNLDLVKPAGTDHALISVLNSNSDKIDAFAGTTNTAVSAVQNGLAYIVGNTNTTGATLSVGQFVYVKGHSTIAEGLRKVTASISANGSITTSNTDACSEGGLNALNSKFTYSSDETVIGKWGNDTLYRRTVSATKTGSEWAINTSVDIATIATGLNIRRLDAVLLLATDTSYCSTSSTFRVRYHTTTGKVTAFQNETGYGASVYIVLEYTK